MNIGDEKGQSIAFVFPDSLLLFFIAQKCSGENLKEISDYFLKITFEYVCFKIGEWVLLCHFYYLTNRINVWGQSFLNKLILLFSKGVFG